MLLDSCRGCLHFLLFLLCFLIAFACAAVAPFSYLSRWFKDIPTATRTLFDLSVGQARFDYAFLCEVEPVFAPALFTTYQFSAQIILFNVFIAILMEAWMTLRQDPHMGYSLLEETKEGFRRRLTKAELADVEELLDALEADEYVGDYSYERLIQLLRGPLQVRTDQLVRSLHPALAALNDEDVLHHYSVTYNAYRYKRLGTAYSLDVRTLLDSEDQGVLESQVAKEGEEVVMKVGFFQPTAGVGVSLTPVSTPQPAEAGAISPVHTVAESKAVPIASPKIEYLDDSMAFLPAATAEIMKDFERFDLDGSGTISDHQELTMLVTSLFWKLRIKGNMDDVMEEAPENVNMACEQFSAWFADALIKHNAAKHSLSQHALGSPN